MDKNKKILIIGFGSIGQRHYRNLLTLGFKNVYVYDVDGEKTQAEGVRRITALRRDVLKEFDVALICSPNNLHIKHASLCAKAGCHLFVEKPLSHDLRGIKQLTDVCRKQKLIALVGCNMRFHPCLRFIKNYLENKRLGKIYTINHEFGYYLPYWRPKQDYRRNYAVKRAAGGGIILDDIHEFDLLFWLNNFEPVLKAKFVFGKVSDLESETEDAAIAAFKFKNNVLGAVRCDYLQQSYSRNCKVVGERGTLEWNFHENIVWLSARQGKKKLFEVKKFDFNDVYIDEMKYFLKCVQKRQKTFNDIQNAYGPLSYCVKRA